MNLIPDQTYTFKFLKNLNETLSMGLLNGNELAYKSCKTKNELKPFDELYCIFKKIDNNGNPLFFQIPEKFEYEKEYIFKFLSYRKDNDRIIIGVDDLGNTFEIFKNYSCITPLKSEQDLKCKPLQIKSGTQRFRLAEYFFIDQSKIFKNKSDIDFINKDYGIDYSLFYQFKNQYLDKNNLWLVTISNYILKAIPNFLYRNRYDDAIRCISMAEPVFSFLEYALKAGGLGPFKSYDLGIEKRKRQLAHYIELSRFFKTHTISELKELSILKKNIGSFQSIIISSNFELITKEDIVDVLIKIKSSGNLEEYVELLKFVKSFYLKYITDILRSKFKKVFFDYRERINNLKDNFTDVDSSLLELIIEIDESTLAHNIKSIKKIYLSDDISIVKKELINLNKFYFNNYAFNNKKITENSYLINDVFIFNKHYITYHNEKMIYINKKETDIINSPFYLKTSLEHSTLSNFMVGQIDYDKSSEESSDLNIVHIKTDYQTTFFTFYGIEVLMFLENNIEKRNKIINVLSQIGSIIRSPKTYLLPTLNQLYYHLKNINDYDTFEAFEKINIDLSDERLINKFPQIKNVADSISLFKFINKKNINDLISLHNSENKIIRNTAKKISVYNIIGNDDIGIDKNMILKNIFGTVKHFERKITNNEVIKKDHSTEILELIEKGEIIENKTFEFKASLICPTLNKDQQIRINNLKNSDLENSKKDEIIDKILSQINMNDKNLQKEIFFSTFKNVCAMLNSDGGNIIIGVKDIPSKISRDKNELVGLNKDYDLMGGFDELQLHFDNNLKNKMIDYTKFEKFIKIKKVEYKSMDFMIIEVEVPYGIKEPCIIKNINNDEVSFKKLNASCEKMTSSELVKFKRTQPVVRQEKTYVYLAVNSDNQTKIGITNNIKLRESSLKTSDPTIKIQTFFPFKTRTQASNIESFLLQKYKPQIIDRDWFEFNDEIYNECKDLIKDQYKIHGSIEVNQLTID